VGGVPSARLFDSLSDRRRAGNSRSRSDSASEASDCCKIDGSMSAHDAASIGSAGSTEKKHGLQPHRVVVQSSCDDVWHDKPSTWGSGIATWNAQFQRIKQHSTYRRCNPNPVRSSRRNPSWYPPKHNSAIWGPIRDDSNRRSSRIKL
jgi:hypothetical protein